jgi:transcriptional/translational regulatory protein YebC/TACO1
MAGHHQWSNVKRLNGALHQNRGQLAPKLAIQVAPTA